MSSLSLFTPISYDQFFQPTLLQKLEELNDSYLSLGHMRAFVIPEENQEGIQYVEVKQIDVDKRSSVVWSALKVITYATCIFPIIAFAVRAVFRLVNNYKVISLLQPESNISKPNPIYLTPKLNPITPQINDTLTGSNLFERIPIELVKKHIMYDFSGKDLVRFSWVSSQFYQRTLDNKFQRNMIFTELIEIADQIPIKSRGDYLRDVVELGADFKQMLPTLELFAENVQSATFSDFRKVSLLVLIAKLYVTYKNNFHAEKTLENIPKILEKVENPEKDSLKYDVAEVLISLGKISDALEMVKDTIRIERLRYDIVKFYIDSEDLSSAANTIQEMTDADWKSSAQEALTKAEKQQAKKTDILILERVKELSKKGKFSEAETKIAEIVNEKIKAKASSKIKKIDLKRQTEIDELQAEVVQLQAKMGKFSTARDSLAEIKSWAFRARALASYAQQKGEVDDISGKQAAIIEAKEAAHREEDVESKMDAVLDISEIQDNIEANETLLEAKEAAHQGDDIASKVSSLIHIAKQQYALEEEKHGAKLSLLEAKKVLFDNFDCSYMMSYHAVEISNFQLKWGDLKESYDTLREVKNLSTQFSIYKIKSAFSLIFMNQLERKDIMNAKHTMDEYKQFVADYQSTLKVVKDKIDGLPKLQAALYMALSGAEKAEMLSQFDDVEIIPILLHIADAQKKEGSIFRDTITAAKTKARKIASIQKKAHLMIKIAKVELKLLT